MHTRSLSHTHTHALSLSLSDAYTPFPVDMIWAIVVLVVCTLGLCLVGLGNNFFALCLLLTQAVDMIQGARLSS